MERGWITITDMTTSTQLLSGAKTPGLDITSPYWFSENGPINGTYPEDWYDNSFRYDAWEPDHEYRLAMSVETWLNWPGEEWTGDTRIGTDIVFSNVPEPFSIILFFSDLGGDSRASAEVT